VPAPEIVAALTSRFSATPFALGVAVPPASLLTALRALRDAHGYRYYVLCTGAETETSFEIVHAVRNLETRDTLFVKAAVPKDAPAIDSAAFVYAGAEWHEREIFDLFGVGFTAHPDLRRILMPDEYEGHPLRKAFAMDTPWGYRPKTGETPEAAS
jgi:NADH-quinone oxidoreductase subunit C